MTHIVGTPTTGGTPALTVTVPPGVTAGMVALITIATADGTDWDPVPFKSGARFVLLDDRAATNMRVTVWTGTGLVAGDVIGFSAANNGQCAVQHIYQDEYVLVPNTLSAAVRSGSVATCTTGSVTPAAGQNVVLLSLERTTATGTTVSSAVSSGAEPVTTRSFAEVVTTVTSVYVGTFTASAAAARTATVTYNSASGNGYAALILTEPMGAVLASETFTQTDGTAWPSGAGSVGALGLDPVVGGGGATCVGGRGRLVTGNTVGYLGTKRISRRANITARKNSVWISDVIFDGSEVYPRVYVRSQNSTLDGSGGYYCEFTPNVGGWRIGYATSFVGPTLLSGSFTFTPGVAYRLIFGVVDDAVKLQIYRADQLQPSVWTAELTDTNLTGTGPVGITVGAGNAANTSLQVDNVTVTNWFPQLPAPTSVFYTSAPDTLMPAEVLYTSAPGVLATPEEVRVVPSGYGTVAAMLAVDQFAIGHRGGSASWPEMSAHGYTQAAFWGMRALEISVGRSSDGVMFGLHDETLDRTSGTTGYTASAHTWAEISAFQINPPSGSPTATPKPYARLEQLCEMYEGHVLFVDPKYLTAPQRAVLLAYLLTLPDAANRVVWKYFGPATDRAAEGDAAGLTTWGYYYEEDDVPATAGSWDLLGMDHAASQGAWDEIKGFGKPVIGHVISTVNQAGAALAKGADGLMVAGVTAVVPRA